jgi:hypothetical protein
MKALHTAILASPHLLAVFRLDAYLLYQAIVSRTLPDDHIVAIMSYLRLHKAILDGFFDGFRLALEKDDLKSGTGTIGSLEVVLRDIPTSVMFRTLPQATRIHDLAHFILRSKLDYLPSLRYERLADPCFTYNQRRPSQQTPEGILMEVLSHLSDPRWIEENRAVRALWLLAIRCRDSGSFSPDGQSGAEEWTCAVLPWMDDETAELETSLAHGSTLLPPGSASGQARSLPDILRPYPIPQPPYRRNVPTLLPPRFSQSPVTMPVPSARSTAWEQDISCLSKPLITSDIVVPAVSEHRPTTRWRRQRHALTIAGPHARRTIRMNERRVFASHDLLVLKVRVIRKLGKSSERVIVSQQAANVSNTLLIRRRGG